MMGLRKYFEIHPVFRGEVKKRHNNSFFKTETWDVALGLGHMIVLSFNLGASFFKWGLPHVALKEQPVDREFCKIFVELNDCIMKKVMYHRGLPKQRMFIKTHLLIVARELEQQYDGAKFLTMVREPIGRFCSCANFVKVVSADGPMKASIFPVTWRVVRNWVIETQTCYCEEEIIFYNQSEENTKNKLAISFDTYVNNLADTLQHVYSFLNIPVSAELLSRAAALQKSSHDRTKRRTTYDPKYNRSLFSLGVDEEKLKEYLSDYINWMNKLECIYPALDSSDTMVQENQAGNRAENSADIISQILCDGARYTLAIHFHTSCMTYRYIPYMGHQFARTHARTRTHTHTHTHTHTQRKSNTNSA